jgi:hypothetical protein
LVSDSEFDFVAQVSHFGWGMLSVALPTALAGPVVGLLGGGVYVLYAAVKEFWYDERYESPAVRGSSSRDFLVQLIGVATAVLLIGG